MNNCNISKIFCSVPFVCILHHVGQSHGTHHSSKGYGSIDHTKAIDLLEWNAIVFLVDIEGCGSAEED